MGKNQMVEEAAWYRAATDSEIDAALQAVFVDGYKRGGCNCVACYEGTKHKSDCALHGVDTGIEGYGPEGDGISYEGPCNCK